MCNTCSFGQVKFATPISSIEVYNLCDRCPNCKGLVISIEKNKFSSLIASWKILTSSSEKWEIIKNVVYDVFIVV